MAELKRRLADDRAAGSFYRLALGTAAQARSVPAALHSSLQRAEQFLAETDRAFADHLPGQLRGAGIDAGNATPRVDRKGVVLGQRVSVRLDHGGRRIIKNKI